MEATLAPIPDSNSLAQYLETFLLARRGGVSYYALPPELNYLAITPDDQPCMIPLPPEFMVIAGFDSKGLAARTSMAPLAHIEFTWVREDLRSGRVALQLVKELESAVASSGRTHVIAFAHNEQPEMADYLSRIGYTQMQVTVWEKNLTNKED